MNEKAKAIQEASKFGTKALETTEKLSSFLSRVFGTLPEDVIGIVGADWLHHIRIRNIVKMAQRTDEILRERGITKTHPMSPSVAIPLLHSAQDESRESLHELWARLLANGMDPNRSATVRLSIISIVKSFDPLDAVILERAYRLSEDEGRTSDITNLQAKLQITQDEYDISIQNLQRLGCFIHGTTSWKENVKTKEEVEFTPIGREIMRACSL
jgi:hypothetical protein